MSTPHPEIVVLVVTLVALALAPVASRLVGNIGAKISSEVGGGPGGPDEDADDEIRQLIEARAFVRGERTPDIATEVARVRDPELHDEIRSVVIALNEQRERTGEPALDVEAEVARRLAALS